MIQWLKCQDFQAHKDSLIEFSPGVTTIIGPNGVGKTAMFRALQAVLLNDCSGDGDVRLPDASKFTVAIKAASGEVITREKGKGVNSVHITPMVDPYQDFGIKYPKQIYDHTKIREIMLGDKCFVTLQIQDQDEPPFLCHKTYNDIFKMKYLNRLSGAYLLSEAVKQANADLLKNRQKLEAASSELDAASMARSLLDKEISKLNTAIEYFEKNIVIVEAKESMLSDYRDLLTRLNDWKTESAEIKRLSANTVHDFSLLQKNADRYISLVNLNTRLTNLTAEESNVETRLQSFKDMSGLSNKIKQLEDLVALLDKHNNLTSSIETVTKSIEKVEESCAKEAELLKYALKSTEICPICDSIIDEEKATSVIRALTTDQKSSTIN